MWNKTVFVYIDDYFFIEYLYGEINIVFISDFKDITIYLYMNQLKSMLSRKLIIIFYKTKAVIILISGFQIVSCKITYPQTNKTLSSFR